MSATGRNRVGEKPHKGQSPQKTAAKLYSRREQTVQFIKNIIERDNAQILFRDQSCAEHNS